MLALARGIRPGDGCRCRVCGPSPFSAGGKLGDNFTDLALLADPSAREVCLGCAVLLAGRPGDDPPPLRTTSVLASATADAGHVEYLGRRDIWRHLIEPYPVPHVLSWAVGGQRHHWLRAGLSTPTRLLIGTCNAPLAHGSFGESAGNATLIRRMAIVSLPGMPRVPVVSGNALRGTLRRLIMRELFATAVGGGGACGGTACPPMVRARPSDGGPPRTSTRTWRPTICPSTRRTR
jgi:hypothetical protein